MSDIQKMIDEWVGSDPDNVGHILTFLEDACYATGAHVSETWQDEGAGKAWDKIARAVGKARIAFTENRPY